MEIKQSGIKLDRELSDLDKFAIGFSKAIGKCTKYVIVSGYVSILLGRARASEDIDMLVPVMDENEWAKIYGILIKEGYYCLNADGARGSYNYLKDGLAVRFAPKGIVIPNMEILFAAEKVQKTALDTAIPVVIGKNSIIISNLELQIAYKENVLKSPKDLAKMKNQKQRMDFVDYWAKYVRTHSDKEWSRQQNVIINSCLSSAMITAEQFLKMKDHERK